MSLLRFCFPSLFRFLRWLREGLTPEGQALTLALASAGVGQFFLSAYLAELFAAAASLWLTAWLVNRWLAPRLEVRLLGAHAVSCGEEQEFLLGVRRTGWLPAFDLTVAVTPRRPELWRGAGQGSFCELPAHDWCSAPVRLTPRRRGVLSWPELTAVSSFPFRLHRNPQLLQPAGELIVYPYRGGAAPGLTWAAQLLGELVEVAIRAGDQGEYVGSREYVPGLPSRRWDYRRWARLGKPVVREYQETDRPRLTLVIDPFLSASELQRELSPQFEAVLSAAARLIDLCWEQQVEIPRLILGELDLSAPVGRGLDREQLLEHLARAAAQPERGFPRWERVLETLPAEGRVLAVLSGWSPLRRGLAETLTARLPAWQGLVVGEGGELPGGMPLHCAPREAFLPPEAP